MAQSPDPGCWRRLLAQLAEGLTEVLMALHSVLDGASLISHLTSLRPDIVLHTRESAPDLRGLLLAEKRGLQHLLRAGPGAPLSNRQDLGLSGDSGGD